MNNGVNLINLKSNQSSAVISKKMQIMRFFAVIMLFVVSASAISLFTLIALSPLPELQKQEQSLKAAFASYHTQTGKLALIDERITSIDSAMKQKKHFDTLLGVVQNNLSPDVKVTALRVNFDSFSISVSSPSLRSLDNFIAGILSAVKNKQGFSSVTLNDLASDNANNNYMVSLTMGIL